jgi:hypothetical protein
VETIDVEAKLNARLPVNIDFMSQKYICQSAPYIVNSPSLWVLEKNLFYLLRYSREEAFKPKYKMKPSYLSQDEYGTVILDYLLMYVNNVSCIEEFDLTTVIIPEYYAIVEICKDRYKNDNINDFKSLRW